MVTGMTFPLTVEACIYHYQRTKYIWKQLEMAKQDKKVKAFRNRKFLHAVSLDTTSDPYAFVLIVHFLFIKHIDEGKPC